MGDPRCSACNDPGTNDFSWLDQLLFDTHLRIARHGWTCVSVLEHGRTPGWGYTIGLSETANHPELAVVGLEHETAVPLLAELATSVVDGARFDDLPDGRFERRGRPFRVVPVHREQWWTDRFNMWLNYYGDRGEAVPALRALQVLWPDGDDRLPGDPEFDRRVRRRQTRLDRAPRGQRRAPTK